MFLQIYVDCVGIILGNGISRNIKNMLTVLACCVIMIASKRGENMKDRIKEIRNLYGMTQAEFSEKLGVSRNYTSLLESGDRVPSEQLVKSICREFNIRYDWLVNGEEPMMIPQDKYDELIQTILHNKSEFMRSAVMTISRIPGGWEALEQVVTQVYEDWQKELKAQNEKKPDE